MARKSIQDLGQLQKTVMEILWDLGEATAQQVLEVLQRSHAKKLAYTTVLSVLQKLEKNGWLKHRLEGRSYLYRAVQSRSDEGRRSLKSFMERVFGGDPLLLFQHLVQHRRFTRAELDELQQMIRKRRKELDHE